MAYPTTWDTFSTKGAGDTIMATHVNALQTSVVAIEEKLGSGTPLTASTNTALLGTGASSTGYQVISLANTSLVSGILPVASGGTGTTTGLSGMFGVWADKSATYSAQQVTTDGFVVGFIDTNSVASTKGYMEGFTDVNANPTTMRVSVQVNESAGVNRGSFTIPVKKNDYWKIVLTQQIGTTLITVYWIPLGS